MDLLWLRIVNNDGTRVVFDRGKLVLQKLQLVPVRRWSRLLDSWSGISNLVETEAREAEADAAADENGCLRMVVPTTETETEKPKNRGCFYFLPKKRIGLQF